MANSKQDEEDVAVDQYGRALPVVTLVTKDGVELSIHDASSLSNLHYSGMGFADDKMTYAKALAHLVGERAQQVLVEVPPEGGDVVWPDPAQTLNFDAPVETVSDDDKKSASKKSAAKSD
jgi:hypothetical protein